MIHKTALIDPKAKLDSSVEVGAYSIIGPNVEIGKNTKIQSHVSIIGHTIIGNDNRFFPFSSINIPQDLKYNGEDTKTIIGVIYRHPINVVDVIDNNSVQTRIRCWSVNPDRDILYVNRPYMIKPQHNDTWGFSTRGSLNRTWVMLG